MSLDLWPFYCKFPIAVISKFSICSWRLVEIQRSRLKMADILKWITSCGVLSCDLHGWTRFWILVFYWPFSPKPVILWSPKMAAIKLTTQTLFFFFILSWLICWCHSNINCKEAFKISFTCKKNMVIRFSLQFACNK